MKNKLSGLLLVMLTLITGCNGAPVNTDQEKNTQNIESSSKDVAQIAASCDPGLSINPVDKGKSFQSTNFKYTLLDVRKDKLALDPALQGSVNYDDVLLVKLEVENISKNNDLNLSIAEVDLTRNTPPTDSRTKDDRYTADLFYGGLKGCTNLATDVDKGSFPAGKKVVGYYVYGLPADKNYDQGLYFGARYFAAEDVASGKSLKVAGYFKLQ